VRQRQVLAALQDCAGGARWSIRSEAGDLFRATLVIAAVILAILFWFRLPDVSCSYLLLLFPVQFLIALLTRAAIRVAFRRMGPAA
jgi:hypothetical protein